MDKFVLKLYVTGQTSKSQRANANLRQICKEELGDRYELTIVDILENPQLAEEEKIIVTPTLVKESPKPTRRIIGDLSDAERVLQELDFPQTTESVNR
ncbi:circadian clock KaiB family protein [bacterium]|nr:circadian clock KaiB family protein [bacterium]